MRSAYLVSYDISDDKRRNAVFKTLMDSGDHVQYSVFICELTRLEHVRLRGELAEAINAKEDQVIFLRVGGMESLDRSLECLGRPWEPMCRVQIV
jgi:CRISPR-associated protein Cas2